MTNRQGFVVVQKPLAPDEARYNRRYRGVDRLVPWTMERYKKGFDDPYLSSNYATDDGFILSLPLAQHALLIFTEIVKPENLEILWINERSKGGEEEPVAKAGMKFLGFDVAGNGSPFYSLVSDFPPTAEIKFQGFVEQLNVNGLFDSAEIAKAYQEAYLERYPEAQEQGMVIWSVYLVLQDTKQTSNIKDEPN